MARKHGGIEEIIATGQAPGMIIKGDRKGRAFDDIAPKHRVCDTGGGLKQAGPASLLGIGEARARAREKAHSDNLEATKNAIKRQGGQRAKTWKLTHSIPAELFYGKIKESGDKDFWEDPGNRDASGGKMPA